jgi:hypothetical protein
MRWVIWLVVGCVAFSVLVLAYLAKHALPSEDLPPLDAQQREYQEENQRLIEELIAADKRHAREEEVEKIRKERREVTKRFYEYNKTLNP